MSGRTEDGGREAAETVNCSSIRREPLVGNFWARERAKKTKAAASATFAWIEGGRKGGMVEFGGGGEKRGTVRNSIRLKVKRASRRCLLLSHGELWGEHFAFDARVKASRNRKMEEGT